MHGWQGQLRPPESPGPKGNTPSLGGGQPHSRSATTAARPTRRTGLVFDELCLLHKVTPGHPERSERLVAIRKRLKETGLLERLAMLKARDAELKWLTAIHTPSLRPARPSRLS